MREPHYYTGLCPYTFSVDPVAASAITGRVADEAPSTAQRWLQVLKPGGTLRPLELLQLAGIDLASPTPIRVVVAYGGSPDDELERAFPA